MVCAVTLRRTFGRSCGRCCGATLRLGAFLSGALEEGVITPEDTFFCDGGEQIEDRYIQCHSHDYGGHGMVDLSGALEKSCNDALMQIAAKEGIALFDKYQVLFGFGQSTNVDQPDDSLIRGQVFRMLHTSTRQIQDNQQLYDLGWL